MKAGGGYAGIPGKKGISIFKSLLRILYEETDPWQYLIFKVY